MFTRIIIVLTTAAVLSSCSKEPAIDYLALNHSKTDHIDGKTPDRLGNLKGHIRSITQFAYRLEAQADSFRRLDALITGTPSYTLVFTREGRIAEEWGYRVEDIVASKTWYRSYREFLIDSTVHWTDEGTMTSREVYAYDKDGILVGGYEQYDGLQEDKVLNKVRAGDTLVVEERRVKNYYVDGRRVKMEVENNNIIRVYRYYYFPSGALRQEISGENGTVDEDERFDGMGNLVYWLSARYEDDRLTSSREETLTYQNGLCVQKIETHFDVPHTWTDTLTYEYLDGRRVRSFKNAEPYGFYEYNEHNDVLRERIGDFNEGYRYVSYDEEGNWTERISLVGDKPFHVEVRRIEYY